MKKQIFVFLLISFMATSLIGCTQKTQTKASLNTSFPPQDNQHEQTRTIEECYEITEENLLYNYTITNRFGAILYTDTTHKSPHINVVDENILSVTIQAGTGLSTRCTNYYNINTGCISETFTSVLGEYENKVIFVTFKDGVHSIIVQDTFNKDLYYKETVLSDVFVAADPVTDWNILESGTAEITYLKGNNYTKATIYIDLK